MNDDATYYPADVQGLNKEYTYATTRLDVPRGIAARHADFSVYRVLLDEPLEADPDAVQDNLGEYFVRAPRGAVAEVVDQNET